MILSRRGFGLIACTCVIAESDEARAAEAVPAGYTAHTYTPGSGRAPRMQARLISGSAAPRIWAVIFREDDEIMSGLSDWMTREHISGAHLTALGAFSSARFGWFDKSIRAYRNIDIDEQVECVALVGDIGLVKSKPALHVHGSVGTREGLVKGGHLLSAVASPTLEVWVTESTIPLQKDEDPLTTLQLFDLNG